MYIDSTERCVTSAGLSSCAATLLPSGSVLFSSRAPIGHVAINRVPMATNQGFKSFIPHADRLEPRFLYYWLRANRARLESLGNGATFKELSKAAVSRLEIGLPALGEQRRIADILDKADALRAKRRAALAQIDALTQSIFLDMFGDPVTNPRRWPLVTIGGIGTVVTGNTPPRSRPDFYGADVEWIKSDNLNGSDYYATAATEGLSALGREVARVVPAESILVTCIAGSPACIGNSAMTDRTVAFNQQINALVPHHGNAHFVFGQLRAGKTLVQRASTSGMKGIVTKSRFEQIALIWPPANLQREFAGRALAVRQCRQAQASAASVLDTLFSSLQHRAFRGEL